MAIGDYTKVTYVNGTSPSLNATNLNNNENKTDELDEKLSNGTALTGVDENKKRLFLYAIMGGI